MTAMDTCRTQATAATGDARQSGRVHRGQAMFEFALVLPTFILVLFGAMEFGWAVYAYNTVSHMANEGARRGMVLNRPASTYYNAVGNTDTNNTYNGLGNAASVGSTFVNLGAHPCPAAPTAAAITIMESIACQKGALPLGEINVLLDTPTQTAYPNTNQNVPQGNPITVIVRFNYRPIITYPIPSNGFTMSSTAVTQTQ